MPIKINYLTPSDANKALIGKLVFMNEYRTPAVDFPYYYLGPKNEIIYYSSWPELVPYLYDKKLGFFTTINNVYQFKDNFTVSGFSISSGGILTLNFNDTDSLNALRALHEDREIYFLENSTYVGWNRTITPLNNIDLNSKIYLTAFQNYTIDTIEIISSLQINLKIKISSLEVISLQLLNNKSVEFGLYRMEGKSQTQSIYYNGIRNKYFISPNSTNFIGGLRTKSQLIGHSHEHTHDMSNHTHTMIHTHDMGNHRHVMTHSHTYLDSSAAPYSTLYGPVLIPGGYGAYYTGYGANIASVQTTDTRVTNNSRTTTDGPSNNTSGQANNSTTGTPINLSTNNNTGINSVRTISKDDIYTNSNNFKVGNKTQYDSNVVYTYIYGLTYFAG